MLEFINGVIIPYMKETRWVASLPANQMGLAIMDVFTTGQITQAVKGPIENNNILRVTVPSNMTSYYQLLDLTINGN